MWKRPPEGEAKPACRQRKPSFAPWSSGCPTPAAACLSLAAACFGECRRFEAATPKLCFGRGEGLPGQAWEAGHPVMLTFAASPRVPAGRRSAGRGPDLRDCLAGLGGCSAQVGDGAVLRRRPGPCAAPSSSGTTTPTKGVDLTLDEGYYGTTGDTFEFLSRSTAFRAGTGLPGLTWARRARSSCRTWGGGSGFLRADSAVKVGINRGLGLPCASVDGQHYVLASAQRPGHAPGAAHRCLGARRAECALWRTASVFPRMARTHRPSRRSGQASANLHGDAARTRCIEQRRAPAAMSRPSCCPWVRRATSAPSWV